MSIGLMVGTVLAICLLSFIFAIPVWLLWNWLLPTIFGVTKLTLIQAWGMSLLCGLLFKGGSLSSST